MDFTDLASLCAYDLCGQQTFTPFECDACHKTYCHNHRTEFAHQCNQLETETVPHNEETKEESTTDDDKTKSTKKHKKNRLKPHKCGMKGCKKREWVLIECPDGCGKSYCLQHRNPLDHACPPKDATWRAQRKAFLERILKATALQILAEDDPFSSCGAQEAKARQLARERHHKLHRYTAF